MAQFRKRPVVVEAVQWFKDGDHDRVVRAWKRTDGRISLTPDVPNLAAIFAIPTREGWHEVAPGDWVVTKVTGEVYLYSAEIFDMTYESLERCSGCGYYHG